MESNFAFIFWYIYAKIVVSVWVFLSGNRFLSFVDVTFSEFYLAHVIKQPNFRIPNPQYFVYLLDQTVGQDILQFIYWNHKTFPNSF